jgi:hypothetical protein
MRSFIVCTLNYVNNCIIIIIIIIIILMRVQHHMRFSRKCRMLYKLSYCSLPLLSPIFLSGSTCSRIMRHNNTHTQSVVSRLLYQYSQNRHDTLKQRSRDSAVGIATDYGLDDGGVGVPGPGRVKNFLHVVQTDCGAHPGCYQMGTGGAFPGGKSAVA